MVAVSSMFVIDHYSLEPFPNLFSTQRCTLSNFEYYDYFFSSVLHLLSGPAFVAWLGGSHTDSRFRRGMGGKLHPEYDVSSKGISRMKYGVKNQSLVSLNMPARYFKELDLPANYFFPVFSFVLFSHY